MAAPSISYRMLLRRFVPLLHSANVSQPRRFISVLHTAAAPPSFTLRSSSLFAVSRQFSDDVALLEDAPIEAEEESYAIDVRRDTEELKVSNLGSIRTPPSLSVKEKKELASYAHSLGEKLKTQQIGKSGVTETVIMALGEILEANELLKLKIRGTCPGEFNDVVNQLEQSTGSVAVGQIGRTVILYRPSMTKLKVQEKRKQALQARSERQPLSNQSPQSKKLVMLPGQAPKPHGRGRRGSSRF